MSSRKVVIDGVTYVRSRDAARTVSLAADYVSRLARAGVVVGRRIQGLWFVEPNSLRDFTIDQERQKELWRAHLAEPHSSSKPSKTSPTWPMHSSQS